MLYAEKGVYVFNPKYYNQPALDDAGAGIHLERSRELCLVLREAV